MTPDDYFFLPAMLRQLASELDHEAESPPCSEAGVCRGAADEIEVLRAEAVASRKSLSFARVWYAERWERLRQLVREEAPGIEGKAWSIMANGTADVNEPPTYAQLLSAAKAEAGRLRAENERLRAALEKQP